MLYLFYFYHFVSSDNESRISLLNVQKTPYLFTSSDLLQVLAITTSIKTKITFIKMIGPRLTDPKAKSAEIIGMFRFSEEKRQVEDVLKARAQTVSTSSFSVKPAGGVLAGGGRGGGRGGRGMNGRGTGGGRGGGAAPTFTSTVPLDVIMDGIEQETPSDNLLANHSTDSEIKDKISISAFQPTSIGEPLLPAPTPSAGTGGGMGGVGVPRKSRKSSIVLSASVMNSLGLGRSIENKENLDEVPLEIWEMKISPEQPPTVTSPRVSSNFHEVEFKKTVSFEEEKVSTSACDQEFKKAEDSDQVSPNQDLDLTQAEDEDPPRGQEHSLPAVTVTETCSQIDYREAEQASDAGSVNNIQPSAVETGGIRGWFARRASFISGQPLLAARPPTPPSEQVVVEETLSLDNGSTARTDEQSANAEQSKIGTNSIAGNEGDASSTVVFSKPDDAQEDESATTESVAETGTSPPSEETRSVVTVPESPQETSPTSERSPPSSPKPGFATRLLRRFSKSSPPPVATTSPQSGTTSKNQRSSLVKLQEERKVGNLLGFFEKKSNAVASGSATPPRSVSPKASSKTANV